MIEFAAPFWLMLTPLLVAGLAAVLVYGEIKRRRTLALLANPNLVAELTSNISMFRRHLKQGLFLAAVFCFGVALARPQMGYRWEEIRRKGIDILFAIDTSRSMLAQDVRPSRLERSKLAVIDFSRNFDGGRLGLVPFAGSAFLMCPLTLDTGAFYESLESLDTSVIESPGTDIGSAIREASQAFSKGSGDEKVLILITDGEDLEGDAIEAATEVAQQGVKIFAVGVGTAAGELVPDFQKNGVSFIRDESGNLLKSRLNEKVLREIASVTGGKYYPLGPKGEGLEAIMRDNRHLMKELEIKESMRKIPLEQFQWPLLAGLILLLAETLIRENRNRKQVTRTKTRPHSGAVVLLVFGLFCLAGKARASTVRDAETNMKNGRYSDAMNQYGEALREEPDEAALLYNKGVAAYRGQDYVEAARAFGEVRKSRDLKLQQKAYYNLGNVRYRAGEQTLQKDRDGTIREWEEALVSYQGALALDKDDKDARFNHDLVKNRLEALKQNPPPKQDQNKEQQKKDQDKDQDKDRKQDDKQEGKQDPQNQGNQDQKDPKDSSGGKPEEKEKKEGEGGEPSKAADSPPEKKEPTKAPEKDDSGKQGEQEPKPDTGEGKQGEPGKEQGSEGKAEQVQPGQMTREEAKALLNAAKSGQKQLLLPVTRGKDSNKNNPNQKNW